MISTSTSCPLAVTSPVVVIFTICSWTVDTSAKGPIVNVAVTVWRLLQLTYGVEPMSPDIPRLATNHVSYLAKAAR